MVNKKKVFKAKVIKPLLLDLGCGQNKQPDHVGVDLYAPSSDIKANLFAFPFRSAPNCAPLWKDNTVDGIFCSHFVEHIPHHLRWPFFEECYRIMKLEAVMRIFVPSWKSERAYGDMTHEWPAVTAMFFYYLSRNWREANKLTYGPYDIKANFEFQCGPTGINPAFADRNQEAQVFACTHHLEAFPDMWVNLTKKA